MKIHQIPMFQDNYGYLIVDESTGTAAAVDPAQPEGVITLVRSLGVQLVAVLCTHHHWDHSGGNIEMIREFPGIQVVGGQDDAPNVPGITTAVADGDGVAVGTLVGRVISIPCHTRGHIAYLFDDALFCGDTLFVAGCGRFFEGDAAQMHHALNVVLAALPDNTRVFCGHEYTIGNLRFARVVEPNNRFVAKKLEWAIERRERGESTVPSTIGQEKTYNPFMRTEYADVQAYAGVSDPVAVMRVLREQKNQFQ